MLTKPRILLCDEPTSGLDSFSALAVMEMLRELAGFVSEPKLFQKHLAPSRIILFSIHQPTSDIFHLFTNIILMNAGRIIFHGTVEECSNLFNSIGLHCPPLYNPAEFYVNRISEPQTAQEIYENECSRKVVESKQHHRSFDASEWEDEEGKGARVAWWRQVVLLSHRGFLNFVHYPKHYMIELLILLVS